MMRELPRLQEIAAVFIRHGLGEFVQRIGIAGVLERAGQILTRSPVAESVTFEELLPELTRSLGRSPFEVFRDIETRAQGAASIAQVHRAKLPDGTSVVLKVRRPGVREKIDADLRLLRRVSELIESEIPEARRYRPAEVAAQFARTLEREADFVTETRNVQRFAKNFADDPNVIIPRIYPEYTSDVLL